MGARQGRAGEPMLVAGLAANKGAIELLYIKFTTNEQTSLPAVGFNRKVLEFLGFCAWMRTQSLDA